jgi:WD40 repeat protein/tetratricopeptide (TPR) repeat protein
VAFSPDGKRLAWVAQLGTIQLWDVATGREARTLQGQAGGGLGIAFSADGTRLAGADRAGAIKVWDIATGREALTLQGHAGMVLHHLAFSPDGKRLAGGSSDRRVRVWDLSTGREDPTLRGHGYAALGVAFSPDGKRLRSGSRDGIIKTWDVATDPEALTLKGHTGWVEGLAWGPDGTRLASGDQYGTIKVWDVAAGQEVFTFWGQTEEISSLAFSPDGTRLAGGSRAAATARVWDARTGRAIVTCQGAGTNLAFSPDGTRLAGRAGGLVKVWDAHTGRELLTCRGLADVNLGVAFSPDGTRLAGGSMDHTVRVWDAATGEEALALRGHDDAVVAVAFSPDGRRLASGSGGNTVKLWDLATGRETLSVKGHSPLRRLAFSPDGRRLASGNLDGTITLRDATTGQEAVSLQGHTGLVLGVAWSPDGRRLASASQDGTVKLWDGRPPTEEVRQEAEAHLQRQAATDCPRQGKWAEAVRLLGPLLATRPDLWRDRQARGHAHAVLGHWREAAADFAAALALLPDDPRPGSEREEICAEVARSDPVFAEVGTLLPADAGLWIARGRVESQQHRWEQAAADYARVIESRPLLVPGYRFDEPFEHACLRLLIGDRAGYERLCRRLTEQAAAAPDPLTASVLARTCALAPQGSVEPARVVRWAEQAAAGAPGAPGPLHTLGLACYRAGRGERAVQCLRESDQSGGDATVLNWLGLALAQHGQGRNQEARAWLDRAGAWLDKASPGSLLVPDWLEAQVLRREAEALLKGDQPAAKP